MIKQLLHAGCGSPLNSPPRELAAFRETRLDVNRNVKPDIVASIVAMPMIEDGSYDAIFCSHCLEHLYAHEVSMALVEFLRVMKPGGEVWLQVPDLQSIGGKLALDQADFVIYNSPIGPLTPLDLIYGHTSSIGAGNLFMGHRTGFTAGVLTRALEGAGFTKLDVTRGPEFELRGRALKPTEVINDQKEEEGAQDEIRRRGTQGPAATAGLRRSSESGGAGNGNREIPERTLRETGVPCASAGG